MDDREARAQGDSAVRTVAPSSLRELAALLCVESDRTRRRANRLRAERLALSQWMRDRAARPVARA